MRDLIGRVAVRDAETAKALRLIAEFDDLVAGGASSATILRLVATLSGVSAGLHDGATSRTIRVDPPGVTTEARSPDPSWPRAVIDRRRAVSVWIERAGEPLPLDQLILERGAQALRVRRESSPLSNDDLVRVACDPEVSDTEREAALAALDLLPPIKVIVTPGSSASTVSQPGVRANLGTEYVVLAPADAALSTRDRTGSALVVDGDVPRAHAEAQRALALAVHPALGGPVHATFEDLGALEAIASALPPSAAESSAEVVLLESLRARCSWVPSTFYWLATGETLRGAARQLHLHHSTLQDRVVWLEAELGYCLRTADGHMRAAAAWLLWRLSGLLQHG